MINYNEKLARKLEEIEQLKRDKKLQEKKEQEAKRKLDDRRKFILGGLVTKYFPDVLRFQPRRTAADTDIEFAPVENFLSTLAADSDMVAQIKLKAAQRMKPENLQQ